MQRAFVLDKNKQPLMPCHPARARELLKKKKAAVYRLKPFTIILFYREGGDKQPVELKLDPGSKTTGIALVVSGLFGKQLVWASNLHHRGLAIKSALDSRRGIRKSRRFRKTRYRKARFNNRTRCSNWLPPSINSRVDNVCHWAKRLKSYCPIDTVPIETVRFDMQRLQNPEITGVEYQKGTLFGYEVREYLLEKWQRRCAYCKAENIRLEIDHIIPKSRSGSNCVSNLTLSCRKCNQTKSNQKIEDFLKLKPLVLKKIKQNARQPLRDAAAVNASRYAIGRKLNSLGFSTSFWTGGRTKFNRTNQGYPKDHWVDAACVGETGEDVFISQKHHILEIYAMGRGCRQVCRVNKYGFPRTGPKKNKTVHGFKTGDLVKATVPSGKNKGTHFGRVAVRSSGNFNLKKGNSLLGVSWRHCQMLQVSDGYNYLTKKQELRFLPSLKEGVPALEI